MDDLIAERIRALEDHLQRNPTSDIAIMTPGIAAFGRGAFDRIMKAITAFAEVCHANEPDEDHQTGSFAAEGSVISFKIDNYERRSLALRAPAGIGLSGGAAGQLRRSSAVTG
jgi:hypothetical protein